MSTTTTNTVTALLTQPSSFEIDTTNNANNYQKWINWLRRFNIFLNANNITLESTKINTFLHVAGEHVEEIYDVIATKLETKLEEVTKLITEHFNQDVNTDDQIIKFRNMNQINGESIDNFIIRLKTQAKYCNFTAEKEEIKLQIITGCISKKIKQKALQEKTSYDELVKFARGLESAHIINQSNQSSCSINIKQEQVNQLTRHQHQSHQLTQSKYKNKNFNSNYNNRSNHRQNYNQKPKSDSRKTTQCGLCGFEYPHKGVCPANGKNCNNCGKLNHFSKMCRSKSKPKQSINQIFNEKNELNNQINQPKLQMENKNFSETNEDTSTYYNLYSLTNNKIDCPRIDVVFCDTKVNMGIDTQASINAISLETYHKLNNKPKLIPDNSVTYAYNSIEPINCFGKFTTEIYANNNKCTTEISVFENARDNLLSFNSCMNLGLLNLTFTINNQPDNFHKQIISKFPEVFSGKIGKLKDCEVKFHINKDIKPIVQPIRRFPIYIRDKLEAELDAMQREDLIEDAIGPTPWVSEMVIVPKPHNPQEIRIVIDARAANLALERERHHIPNLDELIIDLNGAKVISKLDLKGGYHQIVLSEESRYITTFRTPKGLKRYKRLTQGFKPSQELCHHIYETKLQGLEGVKVIIDDLFVYGINNEQHDQRLFALLERLKQLGLTVNEKKCEFRKTSLEFFGLKFSDQGISITENKIKALKEAQPPKTPSELRSFLGLATYCSRAIPKFAEKSNELWRLTRVKSKWLWTAEHAKQFDNIKQSILNTSLAYFNKDWSTILEVDASPVGAAAVLYQNNPVDTSEFKIIAFWSQLFTAVETRYAQVEKEALAIVLACEKFRYYLYGQTFTLITDNKAVQLILNNPKSKPPARIERWNIRLNDFSFNIQHKPGNTNIADYLSRNPIINEQTLISKQANKAEEYINFIETINIPKAVTLNELVEATKTDTCLQKVIKWIQTENVEFDKDIIPFKNIKHELSITNKGLLMRNTRIVVPEILRLRLINIAHEGHQGIVKTKKLLRERVWFPGLDKLVEDILNNCTSCQLNNGGNKYQPLKSTNFPTSPWKQVAIDFFGPLPNKHELMVLTDEHSRFPVVIEVKTTSSSNVLPELDSIFSLIGIPNTIKTDNGPPFNGIEFRNFCEFFGIQHRKIAPLWPQANGQCENFNRNLKKIIKNAINNRTNWKIELNAFLRNYRSTPHSSTNVAPSSLIFIHNNTSRLPSLPLDMNSSHEKLVNYAKLNDDKAKHKMKTYFDSKHRVNTRNFKIDDIVLLNQTCNKRLYNKYTNQFSSIKYKIKQIKGSMLTVVDKDGNELIRNSSFFKLVPNSLSLDHINDENNIDLDLFKNNSNSNLLNDNSITELNANNNNNNNNTETEIANNNSNTSVEIDQTVNTTTVVNSRPSRNRRLPIKFNDYVLPAKLK